VVAGLTLACAPARPATAAELRSRAAFELGCPASSLELVRIDESTGGVMGCGRRVVYIERCDDRCRWSFDREAPAPTWGGWATAAPVAGHPPRQHPFVTTTVRTAPEPESEWRERVPPLLDDEPGF
jgi:hypothetical protein